MMSLSRDCPVASKCRGIRSIQQQLELLRHPSPRDVFRAWNGAADAIDARPAELDT